MTINWIQKILRGLIVKIQILLLSVATGDISKNLNWKKKQKKLEYKIFFKQIKIIKLVLSILLQQWWNIKGILEFLGKNHDD